MNVDLIYAAKEKVPSIPVLINVISQRVRELNNGERPLVKPSIGEEKADIALREIIEGKMDWEVAEEAMPDPMSF